MQQCEMLKEALNDLTQKFESISTDANQKIVL